MEAASTFAVLAQHPDHFHSTFESQCQAGAEPREAPPRLQLQLHCSPQWNPESQNSLSFFLWPKSHSSLVLQWMEEQQLEKR